ncbi:PREDICTED: uncharacterized protein LOC106817978 [Priapulus caudatus]|uniref:Uncharacterized protein LOC106817978 n=1 Tax=Priapulus caudatus TaxID=37621 RepID=A0ABM1F147_PRICU|nr:PREDICTED: uncharacterized protein LOC106817978 [Priapulus caudatus]
MKRRMSRRLSRAGIETIPDTTLLPAGGAQAAEESVVSQLKQEEVKPGRPPPAAAAGCPHQEAAPGMPPAFGKRQRRGMSLADLDVCRQVALAAAADAVPVMTTRSRASDRHGNKDEQPICKRLRRTHNALKSPRNGWQKLGSGRRSATSSVARRQRRTIGHVGDTKHLAPVVATKHVAPAVVKKQVAPAVVTKQVAPAVVTKQVAPAVVTKHVAPAVVKKQVAPAVMTKQVAPAVVTKHVAPAVVTKQVAPAVVKKQVAPAVVTMQVAPAVVTMQVAPAVVTMQVAPAVLTKHVAPAVVKKQVAPAVVKKQVAPAVVTKHVAPAVVTKQVAPAVVTKQVAPAVATKQVTLAVATKQVAPAVAENEVAPAIASKQVAMAGKRRRRATGQGEPAEPRTRQRNPSLPAEMRNDEPGEAPVAEVTTPVMMQECHPSSVESSVSSRLEKESAQGEAEASGEKEDAESSGQHEPATTEKGKPAHPGRPEESSDYGVARVKDAPGVRTRRMSGRGADTSQQHSLDQDPPKRDLPASSPPEGAVSTDSTTTHKTEGGSSIVDNGCVNSTESIVTPDSSEPHVLPPPPLDGSTRQAPLEVSRRTAVLFSRKRAAVARRLLEMPLKKRVPRTRSRSGDDAATAGAPATLAVVVQDPPQPGGASMQSSPRHANSLRAVVTAVAAAVASPPGSPVGSPKMPTSPHTSQGAAAAGAVKVIAPARVKVTAMRVKEESTNVKGPSSPFALSEPSSTTRTHSSAVVAAEGAGERTRRRSMSGHTADTSAGNFPLLQKALGMNGFDSSRQKKDRRGRAVSVSESEGGVSSISSCSSCSDIDFQNSTFSGSECGSGDGGGGTGPGGTKNSGWQRVEDPGESNHLPFNSLDLVWAKCRGYPWYPALVIDPNVPKRSVCQNGEAIPAPPAYVLEMRQNYATPVFLVLFFDARRTWQWLPRDKIEHLGGDACLDRTKVYESKKPAERKAVKKAFDKAMQHRLLMTNSNSLPLDPTHPDAPGC